MTEEERIIRNQIRENERMQKELSEIDYIRRARIRAIEIAQYLKPTTPPNGMGGLSEYNIVKKAEEIYQWLIGVLK